MIRMLSAIAVLAVCTALPLPLFAQEHEEQQPQERQDRQNQPPEFGDPRFAFHRFDDGYLRLDMRTGDVAVCRQRAVGWACQTVPEDRAAFEHEIEHLQSENAALKKALLSHGLPLPDEMMPEAPGTDSNQITIRLPDNADIGRVIAYMGQVWQRFVDAVSKAQKQMLNKT